MEQWRDRSRTPVHSIRRVVRTPARWPRIVELAARYDETLPVEANSGALNVFLQKRKAVDAAHYEDVSLAVIKLMGPGEYVVARAGEEAQGHFAPAAQDYTHSTAPNRRFADTVTQRLIKSAIAKQPPPYTDQQLDSIARNCTLKEDAARKVERVMNKAHCGRRSPAPHRRDLRRSGDRRDSERRFRANARPSSRGVSRQWAARSRRRRPDSSEIGKYRPEAWLH